MIQFMPRKNATDKQKQAQTPFLEVRTWLELTESAYSIFFGTWNELSPESNRLVILFCCLWSLGGNRRQDGVLVQILLNF